MCRCFGVQNEFFFHEWVRTRFNKKLSMRMLMDDWLWQRNTKNPFLKTEGLEGHDGWGGCAKVQKRKQKKSSIYESQEFIAANHATATERERVEKIETTDVGRRRGVILGLQYGTPANYNPFLFR